MPAVKNKTGEKYPTKMKKQFHIPWENFQKASINIAHVVFRGQRARGWPTEQLGASSWCHLLLVLIRWSNFWFISKLLHLSLQLVKYYLDKKKSTSEIRLASGLTENLKSRWWSPTLWSCHRKLGTIWAAVLKTWRVTKEDTGLRPWGWQGQDHYQQDLVRQGLKLMISLKTGQNCVKAIYQKNRLIASFPYIQLQYMISY